MIEAMKQALEALENNRQTHHYCEDTWYSCPKHEEGCANDSEGDECNCGADKANIEIDAAIASLRQAIREHAMYEVQRLGQEIEQEPVATVTIETGADITMSWWHEPAMSWWHEPALPIGTKLFTHPPQRTEQEPVPTIEELEQEIYQNTRNFVSLDVMEWMLKRYYTHPPQRTWVGLTEQEQGAIMEDINAYGAKLYSFADAIEAKLKQKNGFAEEKNT